MPVLYVELTKEARKRLEILAAERGLDMSSYVRQILFAAYQEYLQRKGLE